jgi:chemotaxis protein methyltransferase CheR
MLSPSPRTVPSPTDARLETVEVRLLLEGLQQHYGLDFRHYAPASLKRRILRVVEEEGLGTISHLLASVLHDPACCERLVLGLTVNVTSMFRDPDFFRVLRERVVPALRTYPSIRVWVAGCASGEEVYSLAILLEEENLYDRSRIYATDLNEVVLERARDGIFPLAAMREYTENYLQAGGQKAFSDYYAADITSAVFNSRLRRHVVFAQHNLVGDASFNEFHLIFCRNVMIYFDQTLQQRVFRLFHQSLARFGHLCLGRSESLLFNPHAEDYEEVSPSERIYRRKQ